MGLLEKRQRCQKLWHYGYRLRHDFGKWRRAASSLFSYLLISVLILPKFVEHQLKLGSKLIKIWVSRVEFLSFTRVLLIHIINDGCCSADSSASPSPTAFLSFELEICFWTNPALLLYPAKTFQKWQNIQSKPLVFDLCIDSFTDKSSHVCWMCLGGKRDNDIINRRGFQ